MNQQEIDTIKINKHLAELREAMNVPLTPVEAMSLTAAFYAEQRDSLLAACEQMYRAMMAMGNDLNWDMSDYGYAPPECPQMFPVSFVEAMNVGKTAIAAAKGSPQ